MRRFFGVTVWAGVAALLIGCDKPAEKSAATRMAGQIVQSTVVDPSEKSPEVAIKVTAPADIDSAVAKLPLEVTLENTSPRVATVVWETAREIRVAGVGVGGTGTVLSVNTAGWGSQPDGWITLQPGEKTTRPLPLQLGVDVPALDPGIYSVRMDFTIKSADTTRVFQELKLHIIGKTPPVSLAAIIKSAAEFNRTRPLAPGAERVEGTQWELTPNMYPAHWLITFTEQRPGVYRSTQVCAHKLTGAAENYIPIP